MNNPTPIKQCLIGENAFYNQPNYQAITSQELASKQPLKHPTYTIETESYTTRTLKAIFSALIFPIGFYQFAHSLAGRLIVPASSPSLMGYPENHALERRKAVDLDTEWKIKRISIQVDDYIIDAALLGKASTFSNARWVLASNGNGQFYEGKLHSQSFKHILSELHSNAIVFNYPGVGSSSGPPSRGALLKAYQAVLSFLEDEEKGIGAKEIIGFGHSIGGGVQGDALSSHPLKHGIKYLFIKSRTFSDLSSAVTSLINPIYGALIKIMGWNIGSIESSKKMKAPEIILQTAEVPCYMDLQERAQKVLDDGIISAEASLAKALLEDESCPKENKYFLGVPEGHNDALSDPSHLVTKVNEMIKSV